MPTPGPDSFFDSAKDAPAAGSNSDPFSAMDQAKAKEEFENAFASFKGFAGPKDVPADRASPDPTKSRSAFDAEFPPIAELEKDDESDSADEAGFDDDFAPASPPTAGEKPESPSLAKAVAGDAPTPGAEEATEKQADDMFGSAPPPGSFPEPESEPEPAATPTAPAASSGSTTAGMSKQSSTFDDLDDDFADLEDAKEGSTADDDFQTISRSGLDDFNPTFDSPPPAAKSDSTTAPPGSSHGAAAPFGTESTFDFASIDNTASQSNAAASAEGSGKQPGSHDWDAIFASLDDAPPTKDPVSPPPPGSPISGTPAVAEASKDSGAASLAPQRPDAPGRALTEGGEHDDPILKDLTSMGYSRGDALNALEKYDYNLERVS